MRQLWRLAIGSWLTSPGRALAAVLSVALGVATVVTTTNLFETTRRAITDEVVTHWLGSAHVTVHPVGAHWASIDASLAKAFHGIENVQHVTARLHRRLRLIPEADAKRLISSAWWEVDAIGINPDTEQHFRTLPNLDGRMLRSEDRNVAVIEREMAHSWGVALDDTVTLQAKPGGAAPSFRVIGLFDSARVAQFQRPTVYLPMEDLQELKNEPGIASVIDIRLKEATAASLAAAKAAVEDILMSKGLASTYQVETAAARQILLGEAERITRLLLTLMAFVALLTSFFIILTTQGVSFLQRRPQLGVMRCIGLTRMQLAALLLIELMPLGLLGTLLGIAGGSGVTELVAWASRDMFIRIFHSSFGLWLAAVCGVATTVLTILALIVQVGRIGPLEAVHPYARPARMKVIYIVGAAGVLLLLFHEWMVSGSDQSAWLDGWYAGFGTAALHFGYVLIAPTIVVLLGRPLARLIGRLLGIHPQLAVEPIERGPWRSSGACWVLMVGLSLIVYTAVRAEGVLAIWDFPSKLPEGFVWSREYVSADVIERVRSLPGIGRTTTTTDVDCEITSAFEPAASPKETFVQTFLRRLTRPVYVVGEPEELLNMIKLVFIEGNRDEAIAKMKQGGYVVIPPPTARNKNVGVGDKVTITINGISAEFEVAAVIHSPAMDLAVTAFQAESYMQFAAASAVLGTRRDLKEKFGLDVVSMFMCDLDLPPSPVPDDFDPNNFPDFTDDVEVGETVLRWAGHLPNEADVFKRISPLLAEWLSSDRSTPLAEGVRRELRRYGRSMQRLTWSVSMGTQTRQEQWDGFRSRLVLYRVAQEMDRPNAIIGSLRRLKEALDVSLRRATIVVTWLPSLMLVVATIGIANLMMVSVHLRTRQIAVLRAVGALKSQIVRMVMVEALTLGLLGSLLGLALGLHEAHSVNRIAAGLIDVSLEFIVPVTTIAFAMLLTVSVCLLAAIAPARYAARNNIIEAMQAN